jgi:8-amino-7-oxononanoate synthase
MTAVLEKFLRNKLEQKRSVGAFRSLSTENNRIDFTSNDYLGLARSEELFQDIQRKVVELPHRSGSTGSRLLAGNHSYTEQVENTLAGLFKTEGCLLFNSGYTANLAVLSSIPQRGDTILLDELAHACMKDGARLSMATRHPFRHNDLEDLEAKLKKATGQTFIAVEAVYSMDGDEAPLESIVALAKQYHATLIVDEAHSTGIFGEHGAGLAVSRNLHHDVAIRIHTFGKAMGIQGACVCGSDTLRQYLINFARPFIYTTAPPLHDVAAVECAFTFLRRHPELQEHLHQRVKHFHQSIRATEISHIASHSAIQAVLAPGNQQARAVAAALQEQGFDVRAILAPTVKEGSERLRICLHAYNTEQEINDLINNLIRLRAK